MDPDPRKCFGGGWAIPLGLLYSTIIGEDGDEERDK
jgi:hypothetical protein